MPCLTHLNAFDPGSGDLNVIIETPKGSRNKYEEDRRLFCLSKVLPPGAVYSPASPWAGRRRKGNTPRAGNSRPRAVARGCWPT